MRGLPRRRRTSRSSRIIKAASGPPIASRRLSAKEAASSVKVASKLLIGRWRAKNGARVP